MISPISFRKHARVFGCTALICTALLALTHPAHSAGSGVYDFSHLYPEYSQAVAAPVVSSTRVSASTPVSTSVTEPVSEPVDSYTGIADGYYVGSRLTLSVADLDGIELHNGRGYTFQENGEDFDATMGIGFLVGYAGKAMEFQSEPSWSMRIDSGTILIRSKLARMRPSETLVTKTI